MTQDLFQITVNMRVAEGYVETGRFYIGPDKETAYEVFEQLKGTSSCGGASMLRLDLVEQNNELNTVCKMLECTLCDIAENVKVIVRETFRLVNLE